MATRKIDILTLPLLSSDWRCSVCTLGVPYVEPAPRKEKWRSECRSCVSKKARDYQKRFPERSKKTLDKHRIPKRAFIKWLSEQPCWDCGQTYPHYCMDFDHREQSDKAFLVSYGLNYRWDKLIEEVLKCDMVCSNCHRIRTFQKGQNLYKNRHKNAKRSITAGGYRGNNHNVVFCP